MCDNCENDGIDYSQYEVEITVREKKTGAVVGGEVASYNPNPECPDFRSEVYSILLEAFDMVGADNEYEANQKGESNDTQKAG